MDRCAPAGQRAFRCAPRSPNHHSVAAVAANVAVSTIFAYSASGDARKTSQVISQRSRVSTGRVSARTAFTQA